MFRRTLFTGFAAVAALLTVAFTSFPANAVVPTEATGAGAAAASVTAPAEPAIVPTAAGDDPACQLPMRSTFHYSGEHAVQCTVPAGITELTVIVVGGHGGSCPTCGAGGEGGETIASLPVQEGDPIRIWVGQRGQNDGGWGLAPGGARGTAGFGGYNAAGGGGASGVAIGTTDSAKPLIVAGGGGGGGGDGMGGDGAGGWGGSGGNPAVDGAAGGNTPVQDYTQGLGGSGGAGGGASNVGGGGGASPSNDLYSAGGGGGGGWPRGGDGGGGASALTIPIPGGGGGGGGGGDSTVVAPARMLVYTASSGYTDGSVTLSATTAQVLHCTGSEQTFDVPANVPHVHVMAVGGQGGDDYRENDTGKPGFGAQVTAILAVDPDHPQLKIDVGCGGTDAGGWGYGSGGWQGGAAGAGHNGRGGGGGSAVKDVNGPVVVAGGGGGAGGTSGAFNRNNGGNGGNAGYGFGKQGAGSGGDGFGLGGGQGGTGGGNGWIDGQSGEDAGASGGAGGGGGGGFIFPHYGGGISGGDGAFIVGGGGGGAGASYVRADATSDAAVAVSGNRGDGFVFISWETPMPTHIAIVSGNNQTSPVGQPYDQPLAVKVTDQNDLPLGGTSIAFFAPASGASVAFSNNHNYDSAQTNADGIAVSSTLTANNTAGKLSVVAGSIQTSAQVSFSLQNALPSVTTSAPKHDTVVFGQPNSDAVTVTGAADGPRPTGAVSYWLCGPLQSATGCTSGGEDAGSSDLAAATDNSATATSESRPAGSPGTWCYRSSYAGDDAYGASSDAGRNECFTVTPAATTTTLSQKPTSPVSGQPVTLDAAVTVTAPGAGTPTGTVTFTDGGTSLGTSAVDATGTATLDVTDLGVGAHTLAATYSGDANMLPSASSKHDYPVDKAASKTTVSTVPDASVFGQPVTLNVGVAAVAPGVGTPTGSVRFTAGTTDLGTAILHDGAASVTTSALAVGSDAITVSYGGDVDFASSTDHASVTVSPAATTTTVSAEPVATVFGQEVTLNARVSVVAPGAGAVSGTVEFTSGATVLGTARVDASGSATIATTALPLGQTQVSARYVGTTDFAASAATSPATVTVSAADTRTSVSIDPDAAVSGQHVTVTAHVVPMAPASGAPTGTVVFTIGSTTLGTGHLDATGVATFTTSALPVGPSQITATYQGDASFHPSAASAAASIGKAATATIVTADPSNGPVGSPIILTAWITVRSPGSGTPTGTVTFTVGTTTLGTAAVTPTGLAKLTVTDLPLGASVITASYGGDTQRAESRGTTSVSVTAHGGTGGNGGGGSGNGSLPATGSGIDSLLGLGMLVLLSGAALWLVGRGRSRKHRVKRG
jgi:hypothetical protein